MRRILGTRILNPDFLSRSWVENSGKLFWAEPADMDVVCMDRALPPLPDDLIFWNPDVRKKNFVEIGGARHIDQRSDLDPRRVHFKQ